MLALIENPSYPVLKLTFQQGLHLQSISSLATDNFLAGTVLAVHTWTDLTSSL